MLCVREGEGSSWFTTTWLNWGHWQINATSFSARPIRRSGTHLFWSIPSVPKRTFRHAWISVLLKYGQTLCRRPLTYPPPFSTRCLPRRCPSIHRLKIVQTLIALLKGSIAQSLGKCSSVHHYYSRNTRFPFTGEHWADETVDCLKFHLENWRYEFNEFNERR